MALLYLSTETRGRVWRDVFARELPELSFLHSEAEVRDASDIRYVAAWTPPEGLVDRLPNLELLMSVGAGVDQFDLSRLPDGLGVVRMIAPGIRSMMVDYVTMGVLALHRGLPRYLDQQRRRVWDKHDVPLARRKSVGIMGLGQLGRAALEALGPFDFQLRGWAQSRHDLPGVETFAGPDELSGFLAETDILVCLLPLTEETKGILSAELLTALPDGAGLVHAGRGPQLDASALIGALDGGHLSGAVLDVTDPEPLPVESPLWSHPGVILTPHVATQTDDEEGALAAVAAIRAHESGAPVPGLVDRTRRY